MILKENKIIDDQRVPIDVELLDILFWDPVAEHLINNRKLFILNALVQKLVAIVDGNGILGLVQHLVGHLVTLFLYEPIHHQGLVHYSAQNFHDLALDPLVVFVVFQ